MFLNMKIQFFVFCFFFLETCKPRIPILVLDAYKLAVEVLLGGLESQFLEHYLFVSSVF